MTNCNTCKHCMIDETERCYRCVKDIENGYETLITEEDKLIARLEKLKGNSGCDYYRNSIINECICEVSNYFSELKGEQNDKSRSNRNTQKIQRRK